VRVNAMLRKAAVEREAEIARIAYLQRLHEIEVRVVVVEPHSWRTICYTLF
jgi:hypothetical protein